MTCKPLHCAKHHGCRSLATCWTISHASKLHFTGLNITLMKHLIQPFQSVFKPWMKRSKNLHLISLKVCHHNWAYYGLHWFQPWSAQINSVAKSNRQHFNRLWIKCILASQNARCEMRSNVALPWAIFKLWMILKIPGSLHSSAQVDWSDPVKIFIHHCTGLLLNIVTTAQMRFEKCFKQKSYHVKQ